MSYILDALKKSEKERQRSTGLDQIPGPDLWVQPSRRRPLWLYLIVIAFVVNAGALIWWIGSWQSSKQAGVSAVSPQPKTDSDLSGMIKDKPVSPVPLTDISSDQGRGTLGSRDTGKRSVPQSAKVLPAPPARSVGRGREQPEDTENLSISTPESESAINKKAHEPPDVTALEQAMPSAETVSAELQTALPTGITGDKRIYKLGELPLSIQKSLPEFSISVYLHADEPASRMVRINGQMMREGQDLAPGLRLEEITPDGSIFSYRNYRFRVGLK